MGLFKLSEENQKKRQELLEKYNTLKEEEQQKKFEKNKHLRVELICPRCGSHKIHTDTRGYRATKGIIGGAILGPIGLLTGFAGKNKLLYTCKECEYQFIRK
ncbi:MAG: hypothetical protein ACRC7S_13965 [Cetobacterium sp.]